MSSDIQTAETRDGVKARLPVSQYQTGKTGRNL